ncbi:MAG: ATP-binding protein [Acidimicrobiia bacterium]
MRDIGVDTSRDVHLVVPASAEYLRLVRLTAAGLASRMGFTFDEVEDLRIAVDELCFLLVDDGDMDRTMELRYSSGDDSITIEGYTRLAGPPPEPNDLSEQILSALVDEHEVVSHGGEIRFRLLKRRDEDS